MRSFTEKFGDVRLSLKNERSSFLFDLSHKTLGRPGLPGLEISLVLGLQTLCATDFDTPYFLGSSL